MKTKLAYAGITLLIFGCVFSGVMFRKRSAHSAANAPLVTVAQVEPGSAASHVMAEGTVVPAQVTNVTVLPSFRAQVTRVYVNNGDHVVQGQVLAELDAADVTDTLERSVVDVEGAQAKYALTRNPHRPEEILQALESVRAARAKYDLVLHPHRPEEMRQMDLTLQADRHAITEAEAHLAIVRTGNRPQQIAQVQEEVEAAQARLTLATAEYNRSKALFDKDLIPRAELEQSATALAIAKSALVRAQQGLSLEKEGSRAEEVAIAQAALERAKLAYESHRQEAAILRQGSRREEIEQARAALSRAQEEYSILRQGSRTEEIQQAQAGLRAAQIEARRQDRLYVRRLVRAPITGVVIARNINPGEIATSLAVRTNGMAPLNDGGRSLFVIADDQAVEFMASVDQRFYKSVRNGQRATVSLEALPGRSFDGRVTRVNPLISPDKTGNSAAPLTFSVWVRVPNKDHLLVPGQIGLITIDRHQSGLVIPQSALKSFSLGEGVVYVVNNGTVNARSVRYDGNLDGEIRVLSGLKQGETVVVSDTSRLAEGMPVRVETMQMNEPEGADTTPDNDEASNG